MSDYYWPESKTSFRQLFDMLVGGLGDYTQGLQITVEEYEYYARKLEEVRVNLLMASMPNRE